MVPLIRTTITGTGYSDYGAFTIDDLGATGDPGRMIGNSNGVRTHDISFTIERKSENLVIVYMVLLMMYPMNLKIFLLQTK